MYQFMKSTKALWGKKNNRDGNSWLPLYVHLSDCVAIADRLWDFWLAPSVKTLLINELGTAAEAKSFFMFIVAAHDTGKSIPGFQIKPSFIPSQIDEILIDKLVSVLLPVGPFSNSTDLYIIPHALAGEQLLLDAGLVNGTASIIGSHHGKPADYLAITRTKPSSYEKIYHMGQEGKLNWQAVQNDIINYALQVGQYKSIADIPAISQKNQILISGLLVMTDWIASNENLFPLIDLDDDESDLDFEDRYETAWQTLDLTNPWIPDSQTQLRPYFCRERFSFDANALQQSTIKTASEIRDPGIMVIEAAMGTGKTEAALLAAEIFAEKTGKTGIFFALPTQATTDGIFPRIVNWVEHLDKLETHSIKLQHGKSQFNDLYNEFEVLGPSSSVGIDDADLIVVHSWFNGNKTALLADFVVGTVDQLLMSALKHKYLMLRHLGLASKVVIVDECHAYDAYMSQYLYRALHWLGKYKVPVIILSATLPKSKRKELIGAYLGLSSKKTQKLAGDWVSNQGYPVITYTSGSQICQILSDTDSDERHAVKIKLLKTEDLIRTVSYLLSDNRGYVGIIVNTVKRAQEICHELKQVFPAEEVLLTHSAFLAPDRIKTERNLIKQLGKKSDRSKRLIVVGTQVLEQSLDIDFDVLFTDLAPMDLLLQRIGRLQRHQHTRHDNFHEAICYVMEAEEEFETGAVAIYGSYLLTRTRAILPSEIILPDDIPTLVQATYDGDYPISPVPTDYEKQKETFDVSIKAKANAAHAFLLSQESTDSNINGWIDRLAETKGEKGEAKVRDSEPSIEVILLKQGEGGVQILGDADVLRQDETPSNEVAKKVARQQVRLPRPLCQPWFIDATIEALENITTKHLAAWQRSQWLDGELFLILNQDNSAVLNGYRLTYSKEVGLQHMKEE